MVVDDLVDAIDSSQTSVIIVDRIPAVKNLIATTNNKCFAIFRLELQASHMFEAINGDMREAVTRIENLFLALNAGLRTQ